MNRQLAAVFVVGLVAQAIKSVSYTHLHLAGFGRHYTIEFRILRETVNKGQNHVAIEDKPCLLYTSLIAPLKLT